MEGKKYEGSVTRIQDPLTKGSSDQIEDGLYLLQDVSPVIPIDGEEWLYVKALITYNEINRTFNTQINYRVGTGASFKLAYKSTDNTNTYISDDPIIGKKRILVGDCSFDVPLVNNPKYNTARVSFPFVMEWDQRVGYEEGCDLVINQRSVRKSYYNKLF